MNVLIFSAQFLPHMGGVENYTYNLSKKLIEKGHTVNVVTSKTVEANNIDELDGITIYRFDSLNLIDGRFPIYKKNKIFKEIFNKLDSSNFDFSIINTRFYFHSLLGVKYCAKRNIPHIVIDHGTSHLTIHNRILNCMGECFEHSITNVIKKYCDDFYAVSMASSQWLKHFGISSKGEIYNAIDLDLIEKYRLEKNNNYRKMYNISSTATVISFTGRLIKEKGIMQMIHAVQKWNKENQDVYCMIAGDGPLLNDIKNLNDPNVILLGRLSFENVIHLLSETDIFCLVSDSEGFSTSLLEAAVCENYIITTARGGAKEVLLDESYGTIIEDNDFKTVDKALAEVLKINDRSAAIKHTKKNVIENFTWENSANKVLLIANSMLNKDKR